MSSDVIGVQSAEKQNERIDWNSLVLLALLTVPAGVMAAVLFLWPETLWIAEIPYAVVEILGSFTTVFLAIFIIARYQQQPKILYFGAGLLTMGIIQGFEALSLPGSASFVWLHILARTLGGLFFAGYVITEVAHPATQVIEPWSRRIGWLLGGLAVLTGFWGVLTMILAEQLPTIVQQGRLTPLGWLINALPTGLFLFSGVALFWRYRQTGTHTFFLSTAILIFLFQASEVFYFAPPWGVIWWLWQVLRLLVYLIVLSYVLKEYIQINNSLAWEINERQKAAEALREANENWRNSFNSLEEVMLIMDVNCRIQNINNSGLALLGKGRAEVIGKQCPQVINRGNKSCQDCPVSQTLRSQQVASTERYDELRGKHFVLKSAPVFGKDGEVAKLLYLMIDITERVKAESREKELQRQLNLTSRLASIGEMAAGIAHDINNPLTSVIGFAQMLTQMKVPDEFKEAVEVIDNSARRAAGIVEKLLTFARRNKPEKEYADVNSIITGIVKMRAYETRLNNIEVTTKLATDLPWTMANVGQLQQVFFNIIMNAEQAMAETYGRGNLAIQTEQVNNHIRVQVADDGPGIAQENLDRLFDPFFTTRADKGGTGLGLSISYGIINEHNGKIYAQSSGRGATFVVELPIVDGHEPSPVAAPSGQSTDKAAKASILVVDDEVNICRVLERLLTQKGHRVETQSDAQTALQRLRVTHYDLILLDIKMPGMDGIEFYSRLLEIDSSLKHRVVCITGDVISPRNKDFLEQTRISYITKPFGIDDLIRQVNMVLERQRKDA